MIPVGTKVRMSRVGKAVYRHSDDNPHNIEGEVIQNERKRIDGQWCLDCLVEWSNGYTNTYDYDQLEPLIVFDRPLEDYL